ncbi:MAG: hypoxanthine phosphoribosyltransferase [Elusimicrobiota bacterium]
MTKSEARHSDIKHVLFEAEPIQRRVCELGEQISRDYKGKDLVLVGILKGCVPFLSDLMRRIDLDFAVDFMSACSYEGESTTGVVRLLLDLRRSVQDKDVLIIEDIVDTGLTLKYLQENLRTRTPRSLEICTMLDKPDCRMVPARPKYVGFEIPNEFVVGYGLDYYEIYRNLPYIGVLKDEAIARRKTAA